MKAIKYLLAGALMIGFSAQSMAQDIKSEVKAITKVIVDNKSNLDAVEDQIKAFYKANKKNPEALAGLGRAYFEVEDSVNAEKYANLAIKQGKNNAAGYILLGDICAYLQDDGGAAAGWYQQAIHFDPQNPQGYIKYASIYRGRSPEEAVAKLEELRKIKPDYPVDAEAGHFFYLARKYDKAIEYYGKTALQQLDDSQVREFALAGYFSGNNAKSLEVSKYGNQTYPRDAVLNRMTFYNSLALKDYPTAIEYADKLINASDSAKIIARDYTNYGHAYFGNKDYTNAIDMFKKSLALEESSDVHKLLSDTYSEMGDVANATAEYYTYLKGKADASAKDYMSLASIYTNAANKSEDVAVKNENLAKADGIYKEIAEKFPSYLSYATYMRATINSNMDPDFTKGLAKPYWEQLVEQVNSRETKTSNDTSYLKQAYYNLGAIAFTAENKELCDEYMRKLLEVDPDNATAKQMLGLDQPAEEGAAAE